MSSLEMIDKKEQLTIKAKEILALGKNEERKLTEEENEEYNKLCKDIADIEEQIRNINNNNSTIKQEKKMENFSLIKAIRAVANNQQLDERSQEVVNAGVEEMRKSGQSYAGQIVLPVEERADVQATVTTAGKEAVAEDKLNILEPLRANLVMAKAGAKFMTGLVGNVSIPTYSGSTCGWEGEIDPASDGAGAFGDVKLSPKRLTAYIDISKQFLIQDSASAEALLRSDIVKAISNKLEATILGSAAGSATQPAGIFNSASAAQLDFAGTVAMEEALENANVNGNYSYIINPTIKATLRTTAKDAGSGQFVMENGEINGIPTYVTSASAGIVIGDFSDYVIAQWGGIDLTVDPYTQAANGKIRLVINAYFDAKPVRTAAFVAGV